jgi:hypothetical protein
MSTMGVNVSGLPAFVFQPSTITTATLKVVNNNQALPIYVGSLAALSTPNAFPPAIAPGAHLYFNSLYPMTAPVYVSGGYIAGTNNSTLTSNATAGASAFTVASTSHMAVGTLVLLGNLASGQEIASVTGTTATAVTVSTNLLYNHLSGETISTATATPVQCIAVTGAL